MLDPVVCNVCNQNEATERCAICGIDLCDICKKVVHSEDISASHRVKGVSTEGVLGPAQKRITVCSKCMVEAEFFESEEDHAVGRRASEEPMREDRLKDFRRPSKGQLTYKIGDFVADLAEMVPDIRGREDLVREILRQEYIETRLRQFDTKIRPFASASDLREWDRTLLSRYRPLYTGVLQKHPRIAKENRRDVACALQSLDEHIRGTAKALASAREVLDEALKVFGPEKTVDLGRSIAYKACNTAVLTGFEPKNLGEMNEALRYAESQLVEQIVILAQRNGDPLDLECRTLHLGSLQFLASEIEELTKICCFGYLSTGDLPVQEMAFYPEVRTPVGMGTVDETKPVLAFFGDSCLALFYTIGRLQQEDIASHIEITGFGNAGHELVRIYEQGKVLTSTAKVLKGVRAGVADLIVVTESCAPVDVVGHAAKVGIPVLAAGRFCSVRLPDCSDEDVDTIASRLTRRESVAIRAFDKAADVVVAFFRQFPGKMGKKPDPYAAREVLRRCRACDRCFHACPNGLQLSTVSKTQDEAAIKDIYDRCVFCGKCETACPEQIPLIDCIIALNTDRLQSDQFRMRPGRGPLSHLEFRDLTFGLVLGGNGPGMVTLLGCGHYPGSDDELAFIAKELLDRNCVVMTAGCAAADVVRRINPATKTVLPEEYPSLATLKGLVNCGGCSADAHIMASMFKFAQLGGGISIKANYDQPADYSLNRAPFAVIIWGPASDKMMAKAAGFARVGAPVVLGPSGFSFSRMLVGNKYDRRTWTMYDGLTGEVREIEPAPPHLVYPVETKEEAVTIAVKLCFRPCALRDPRLSTIDNYTEIHENYFGELPDDWTFYLRSPMELHVMKRMRFLNILKQQYGWDIQRTTVVRARNRDGELVPMEEYVERYGIKQGRYATLVKRLVMREAVTE